VSISVEPAIATRWPDVVAAFGQRGSNPDSCWCQRFCRHDASSNRDALQRELDTADIPVGLLAYVNDQPAGWTRVVPRHSLPGVTGNRALQRILNEDDAAWWVTCIAIRREHRGIGVGVALLRAAVDHARQNDASVLDGHPVDPGRLKGKASPSALFTGTLSMFQAAGFREIGRTYMSRPVMRRDLSRPAP
jgi:GNAT superfamily N-acetyltransferase